MRYKGRKQWFFSFLLMVIGLLLLLLNIGVISLEITQIFVNIIPILFILLGLKWTVDSFLKKSFGKLLFGLFSLALGALIILDAYDLVEFDYENWWKLWPIFIIAIAIHRVVRNKPIKVSISSEYPFDEIPEVHDEHQPLGEKILQKKNKINRGFIVGDVRFAEPNWPLENMRLYNAIGDYYFDFSKAFIPEGETPISIKGWIGDVKMIIPENVPVEITLKVQVGDVKLFDQKSADIRSELYYRSPEYEEASKKIKLSIDVKIGSIRITRI
ncbi:MULTISPECIES: cell wall-active antibiotics response protein LiaF [Bacillaceae]|uniref:cell wall-active antibiotics response protein LiaF n=1 Tax=Bacillaceae TaxID=186817 RepID=UPI001C565688|nr:cell wall-active antibiotics response protein LiaF [Rossellomorea sp. YZS02]MBW3110592.1 cell wall-active antibiotics response protein [Bacillus sp. MCCB 382]MDX8343431.1 cell wall-active antibiotics response protein LiaF [Rossellomorea sp. YZS02]